jgi:hypothetical protein
MVAALLSLLPLPVVARSAEAGWIADPRTGCRVANANPQPNEAVIWSGGCENGLARGQGVLQWYENNRPAERYEGELRDGAMNGHGVLDIDNGGRYEGDFRAGTANGFGELTTARGTFRGVWTNGCFNDGGRRAWIGGDPSSCR